VNVGRSGGAGGVADMTPNVELEGYIDKIISAGDGQKGILTYLLVTLGTPDVVETDVGFTV
jgi:hypothetical protein